MDLLRWLGFPHREALHRDMLGWLLEQHGTAILAPIAGDLGAIEEGTLKKEATQGRETADPLGRVDLRFKTASSEVAIEVKVRSGESIGQLRRYADALAVRAGPQGRSKLIFITETGLVPEHPHQLLKRHESVACFFGTWDQITANPVLTDPLGWCEAVRERARQRAPLDLKLRSKDQLVPMPVGPDWHLHARVLRDFAVDLVSHCQDRELGIIHGPVPGAYDGDSQVIVDLAKPTWVLPVGTVQGLAPVNPFGDDTVRTSVRVRLQIPSSGRLKLSVGAGILPYSRGLGTKYTAIKSLEPLVDEHARRLEVALGGQRRTNNSIFAWQVAAVLAEVPRTARSRTPRFDRPALHASAALVRSVLPLIDTWVAAGGP